MEGEEIDQKGESQKLNTGLANLGALVVAHTSVKREIFIGNIFDLMVIFLLMADHVFGLLT